MARPAARVGDDPRRVRGGVAAPTGARRGAAISHRRRRHVPGRDELGGQPRRSARRLEDRLGGTDRPRRRATPDHRLTCSTDVGIRRSDRGSPGHAYSGARESGVTTKATGATASEAFAVSGDQSLLAVGSDHDAGWADLNFGVHGAWGMGDLAEVGSAAHPAGHRRCSAVRLTRWASAMRCPTPRRSRTSDLDEAQRLAAEADELLRATGSPIGDRSQRRRTRDHRLRQG